jgi:hypothetical protein
MPIKKLGDSHSAQTPLPLPFISAQFPALNPYTPYTGSEKGASPPFLSLVGCGQPRDEKV